MTKVKLTLFMFFCLSHATLFALDLDSIPSIESINVVARLSGDSVQIRWAPKNYETWRQGLKYGFKIDRYTIAKNGVLLTEQSVEALTEETISVWEEHSWRALIEQVELAAVTAQAIFGEDFDVDISKANSLDIVNRAHENDQRFYFALYTADLSLEIAKAHGLYYVDKKISRDERYLYRVSISTENNTLTGSVFVAGDEPNDFLETPSNLQLECKNSLARLRWDRAAVQSYASYIVERADLDQEFAAINDQRFVTLDARSDEGNRYEYFYDSLKTENEYYYRVIGQSIFGVRSAPSEVKSCSNIVQPRLVVTISNAVSTDNSSVKIEWNVEDERGIKGYLIERSISDTGPFKTLNLQEPLPATQREYIDLKPERSNYYKVKVVGTNGEVFKTHSYFVALVDSVPPSEPLRLEGQIDQFGHLSISWKKNQELDLYGYRVFIANSRDEEMAQVTPSPIQLTSFDFVTDVKNLNDSIYLAVVAVDKNQNQSKMSKILAITLPDLIRPLAPSILPITIDSGFVKISWTKSSSRDVEKYEVYKADFTQSHWIRIKTILASEQTLYFVSDYHAADNIDLHYYVIAIDDAGLESIRSATVKYKNVANKLRPAVSWESTQILSNNKIMLRWLYKSEKINSFRVYKACNNSSFMLYKTLSPRDTQLIESFLEHRNCSYQIMAIFSDGTKSQLSEILKL